MTNPVGTGNESPQWSNWAMGGAWLVETLWDHYDYTRDTEYLRNTAYPLMKGAADFMLAWLIPNPHNPNELITAPCTSPEADYITDKGYRGSSFYGGTATSPSSASSSRIPSREQKPWASTTITSSSCNQPSIACVLTISASGAI